MMNSEKQKSQVKVMNPGGQPEDLGLHSHSKISTKHSKKF